MKKLLILVLALAMTATAFAQNRLRIRQVTAGDGGGGDNPTIAWSTESYTGDVPTHLAQRKVLYDSVSEKWFTYSGLEGVTSGIYSTNFVFCDSGTLVCINAGGTSSALSSSAPDYPDSTPGLWNNGDGWSPSPPGPSDRHPDFGTAIDSTRNVIVQVTGLLIGHSPNDYWQYSRNANPTSNLMTQIATSGDLIGDGTYINGSLVHDPQHDVFWMRFGNGTMMVLCRTASLSADQLAAGCETQNVWNVISPSGAPSFPAFANYEWDPLTGKILAFVFDNGGGTSADTTVYAYDVTAQTWTHKDPANKPSNVGASVGFEWLSARITTGDWSGKFLWVRTGHTYSATPAQAAVFLYDSQANTWTQLSVTGTGPSRVSMLAFDPTIGSNGGLIVHEATGGQTGQFLHGVLQ